MTRTNVILLNAGDLIFRESLVLFAIDDLLWFIHQPKTPFPIDRACDSNSYDYMARERER
jgi:hypothetical protein